MSGEIVFGIQNSKIPAMAKLNVTRVLVFNGASRINACKNTLKNIFIEKTKKDLVMRRNPTEEA